MANLFINELAEKMREHRISNLTLRASDTMFCATASNGRYVGVSTKKDLQEAISQAIEEMLASEL